MPTESHQEKQHALEQCVKDMACRMYDETGIGALACKLQEIYEGEFRHNYSPFFPLIQELSENKGGSSTEFLSNNLVALSHYVQDNHADTSEKYAYFQKQINKLCDHLNLEISRISYYTRIGSKNCDLENTTNALRKDVEELTQNVQTDERRLMEEADRVSKIQTDFVGVLGIFSAIVIAFSGSISFLNSTINALASVPLLHSLIALFSCGLVLSNVIFVLLYVVAKIMGRNIYAVCKTEDCSCKEGMPSCNILKRIRKRLPLVFWVNALFIVLILATVLIWVWGTSGKIMLMDGITVLSGK